MGKIINEHKINGVYYAWQARGKGFDSPILHIYNYLNSAFVKK